VFSAENSILIKALRQEKWYGSKKLLTNKQWTLSGLKILCDFTFQRHLSIRHVIPCNR